MIQGRIGKGVLFFVCLYGLFFYGMWMGQMKNVWLPNATKLPDVEVPILGKLDGVPKALYYRPQFLGQFWIGAAAWPAVIQYAAYDRRTTTTPAKPLPVIGPVHADPAGGRAERRCSGTGTSGGTWAGCTR